MHKRTNPLALALIIPLGVGFFWAATAAAQSVPLAPLCESTAGPNPVTIGPGAGFAVLLDGPLPNDAKNTLALGASSVVSGPAGTVGAAFADITLGAFSSVSGDVAASMFNFAPPAASIYFGAADKVAGECATDDGGTVTPASVCKGGTSTDGTSPYVTTQPLGTIGLAVDQEECFDGTVLCQPATAVTVNVPPAGRLTLATTTRGLNVFKAPNIIVDSLGTLTLKGTRSDSVILETPGTINLGPSSKIVLTGGLTAANVLITATTAPGFSGDPGATYSSTSRVTTGNGVTINGEIHGEYGCTFGTNNTVNGAIICDWQVRAGAGLHVNHIPLTIELKDLANHDLYPQCGDPSVPTD